MRGIDLEHLLDFEIGPHVLEGYDRALPVVGLAAETAAETAPAEVPMMTGKGLRARGNSSAIALSTPT